MRREKGEHDTEEVYVTKAVLNVLFFLSLSYTTSSLFCPSVPPIPRACFICPLVSVALSPPFPSIPCPRFLPLLPACLSLAPSLLSFAAVQHSDYHSTHRVRPDSQILLSTLLHHLLLEGATERESEREEDGGKEQGRLGGIRRIRGMKGERGEESRERGN